jgi:hypothetical protein
MNDVVKSLMHLAAQSLCGAAFGAAAHFTFLAGQNSAPTLPALVGMSGSVLLVRLRRKIQRTENTALDYGVAVVGAGIMLMAIYLQSGRSVMS